MSAHILKAELTGVVCEIVATAGTRVEPDTAVLVLESMKMEIPVSAPHGGVVKTVYVAVGDMVNEGDPLAVIEA
ncbi:acetyl-CoA carboxylase biotin carboxyl carrier protein subunit [Caballeronia sp. LZ035]|uniref:acetyl-CoA carboxylase biotin carboxyl carrier protein subunit n=1 Tax=Caballeronia sp. LZ035 TaxID=3038568 RepID=UPI00285CD916|nr:acetyl-CoA carboxylase biotin carboxyl carrier protein subunit [Caballeronia sp. LZ035]MDR5760605.1 acetyl-CoA carboxylase biotin carboxyl carrier protein subunit [Caballeronia sp. LZ035]